MITESKNKTNYHITPSMVKKYFKIFDDEDDIILSELTKATVIRTENIIGKDIATTNHVYIDNAFEADTIKIYSANLLEISGVTVNGVITTGYTLSTNLNSFTIVFDIANDADTTVQINYSAGYTSSTLPEDLRFALIHGTGKTFDSDMGGYKPTNLEDNQLYMDLIKAYRVNF